MITVNAGMLGAVPDLAIRPVDPNLPCCGEPVGEQHCTRKRGHYGPCAVAREADLVGQLVTR